MAEIASTTVRNGRIAERYSLNAPEDGYLVLDCRQPGLTMRDTFAIPVEITGWLKESLPDVAGVQSFEAGIEFATRSLRLLANHPDICTLSGTSAILAAADLLAGGGVDETDRPDPATWVGPAGAKIIPIRGVVAGERIIPLRPGRERRIWP